MTNHKFNNKCDQTNGSPVFKDNTGIKSVCSNL